MRVVGTPDLGDGFDLAAAGLRADGTDLRISVEALAHKLEQGLPECTSVRRRGGGLLRHGPARVSELRVELEGTRYELLADGERVQCARQREVGGISIKREALDPGAWVAALAAGLREQAQRSARARQALEGLLG